MQSTPIHLVMQALDQTAVEVTDFGGATGDLGIEFLGAYPTSKYTVVENPALVALMQGRSAVRFSTEIPPACDVFFTSGTLQYVEEPMVVLRKGLQSARLAAILTRNSFSETDFFHVQRSRLFHNGIGPIPKGYANSPISYPHRTIRESEVMALAHEFGFRCLSRLDETSGFRGRFYAKQLIFLRT